MRIISVISLILACFTIATSQNDIQGANNVCETDCITYSYSSTEDLYWTVIGGVVENNEGPSVEVCWEEAQSAEVSVNSLNGTVSASLAVTINELPSPKILFPAYPICAVDSLNTQEEFPVQEFCQTVCGGETSILEIIDPNPSSNYTWIIEGDNNNTSSTNQIDIDWPDEGYGSVLLIEENIFGCIDSSYVCIKILAKPSLDINHVNNQIDLNNVCQNQIIYLEALSDQSLSYSWSTSDGQSGEGSNMNFSFSETGTYTINLTGTTDCFCAVEESITISVIDFVAPTIDCIGTTCTNIEMTYYATDICGNYNWSIGSNGNVIEGGTISDNYITIEWNDGPTGLISLSTSSCVDPAICTEPAIVLIPVMGNNININGPDLACKDESSVYTSQHYEGSSYFWELDGNGYIKSGQGTNEVTVQWSSYDNLNNIATLSVEIDNCFLECSTRGEKEIQIEEPFFIYSSENFCENSQDIISAYVGYNSAACDWSIVTPTGQFLNLDTNISDLQYDFSDGPGVYEIIAEAVSDNYCNKIERIFVEAFNTPETLTEIDGPEFICIGQPIRYAINNPDSRLLYKWDFDDGFNPFIGNTEAFTTLYGEEVFHQWQSQGPYTINVSVVDPETNCSSEQFELELSTAQTAVLLGNQAACENDIETYTFFWGH